VQVLGFGRGVAHRLQQDHRAGQLVQGLLRSWSDRVTLHYSSHRPATVPTQGRGGWAGSWPALLPLQWFNAVVRLAVRRRQPGVVRVGVAYDMRARRPEQGRLVRGTPDADLVATPRPQRDHVGEITGVAEAVGQVLR
jgi:hypothetical protein